MGTTQMEGRTNLYKFIRPFMDTANYTLTFFPISIIFSTNG